MTYPDYPEHQDSDDLDELLRQVDELVSSPEPPRPEPDSADLPPAFDDDEDDCDYDEDGRPIVYQNYSNHYGADVRNYANNFGGEASAPPEPEEPPAAPRYSAYNSDFRQPSRREPPAESPYEPAYEAPGKQKKQKKRKKRRRGCGCGCLPMLLILVLLVGGGLFWAWKTLFVPPVSQVSIGERKPDAATVLVCGLGYEQRLTDTMMLVYLDGGAREVSLLSLPRDSYTVTGSGQGAKLNSAYMRNGSGPEGMEGLLDYVQNIIGYRPDGYMLVQFDLVTQIVDLMGGLEVEVPMSFELEGEQLEEGLQHLTGSQVLQLLRFREGYAMQDLGRVEVQRQVMKAAMEQWVHPSHIKEAFSALKLVENHSFTNLKTPNFLWMAKTMLGGLGNFSTNTLPGVPDYVDGVSYYMLDLEETADLVNASYNPYLVQIHAKNLRISGDVQN